MKAQKVTVTVTVELLSIDALGGMLKRVIDQIDEEVETGELRMADGDEVKWDTIRTDVVF